MGNHSTKALKADEAHYLRPKCKLFILLAISFLIVKDYELEMLYMIFVDLACNFFVEFLFLTKKARHFGMVDKETFLKFFPLTVNFLLFPYIDISLKGLWGEQLFKKFDLNHTGLLTFYEFAAGIALCCKSAEEDKIKLLFSLYDFDNDGYIEKKELITMVIFHYEFFKMSHSFIIIQGIILNSLQTTLLLIEVRSLDLLQKQGEWLVSQTSMQRSKIPQKSLAHRMTR